MRVKAGVGLIGGVLLLLSSGAHSVLGWKGLSGALSAAGVPPDLVLGLKIGWQFGGVAMLAFATIAIVLFARRLRGDIVSMFPVRIIAATYLGFGLWALVASGFDLFFLIFIVPALLLSIGTVGGRDAG